MYVLRLNLRDVCSIVTKHPLGRVPPEILRNKIASTNTTHDTQTDSRDNKNNLPTATDRPDLTILPFDNFVESIVSTKHLTIDIATVNLC